MSRQLPPPPGVSIQDDTAHRLQAGVLATFKKRKTGLLWTNVRWCPDDSFPESIYRLDLLICEPGRAFSKDGRDTILDSTANVIAAINIVRPESFEQDWLLTPDHLETCAIHEYCLFDPTGGIMRPKLQALRKADRGWERIQSAIHGLFFSTAGFCLDTRHQVPSIRPCGSAWDEEELHLARLELSKGVSETRRRVLEKEIRGLTRELRTARGDGS